MSDEALFLRKFGYLPEETVW